MSFRGCSAKLNMRKRLGVFCLALFVIVALWTPGRVTAQSPGGDWSAPFKIFYTDQSAGEPIIVVDAYDVVHIFWTEYPYASQPGGQIPGGPGSGAAVIYHTSNEGGRWSAPRDIILSPGNSSARYPEVAADPYGRLHLIWLGPSNTLYYSSVDAASASSLRAWSLPKVLDEAMNHPGITSDAQGNIHVVYPGVGNSGVYYRGSADGGNTWSAAVNVASPSRENAAEDYTQLAVDSAGTIHVVWTEFQLPNAWPPLGVFYVHSTDRGMTWSPPYRLAGEGYDQATIKASRDGIVHIIWNGMVGIGGRYYAQSKDSGKIWSKPLAVILPGNSGTTGYPDFTFDSGGVIHAVTTASGTLDKFEALQYINNQSGVWSSPQKISGDLKGKRTQSVELSRIAISEGNRLSVVFEVGYQEIYYVSHLTASPVSKSEPMPTKVISSLVPPVTTTALPLRSPTPTPAGPVLNQNVEAAQTEMGAWFPFLAGVVPASVLLVLVLLLRMVQRAG